MSVYSCMKVSMCRYVRVFFCLCAYVTACAAKFLACVRHGARTQKEKEVGGGEARTRKEISVCQVKLKD